MAEHPILFNDVMVRAILSGRKTQTRRPIVPQPTGWNPSETTDPLGVWAWCTAGDMDYSEERRCPFGVPGDTLCPALPVPGFDERYCADTLGRIWSSCQGDWRILTGSPNNKGYEMVTPADGERNYPKRFVHDLVCQAYYGERPTSQHQVCHLDGDKNNNAPNNLDWGTQSDNWKDRAAQGNGIGEQHHTAKLSAASVEKIRQSCQSQRALAKLYGVSQHAIWDIKNGKTWGIHKRRKPNMPRWASRVNLLVKRVWAERLQDVSRLDIACEGWPADERQQEQVQLAKLTTCDGGIDDASIEWFADIWDTIYAKRGLGWEANPWVWSCEFEEVLT